MENKKADAPRKGAKKEAAAPPQPALPAQRTPSGIAAMAARQVARADPDTKKIGGFTPLEDTRDI